MIGDLGSPVVQRVGQKVFKARDMGSNNHNFDFSFIKFKCIRARSF